MQEKTNTGPTITILVPCHNEEKTIEKSLSFWLNQTKPADEIVVIDDGSTDKTGEILRKYTDKITYVYQKAGGNKSFAQETGLKHITTDIVIATDADTLMNPQFVERVYNAFKNEDIDAFAGYVQSLPFNMITACREIDYTIGQDLFKTAQDKIDFLFVIPGCAGAFKTETFRKILTFDHDTLTEDLDFTYKLHKANLKIKFDKKAVVYTQDPNTLRIYLNQMRRWYSGGFQNLQKHWNVVKRTNAALELSLMYIEGLLFSLLLLLTPILNPYIWVLLLASYTLFNLVCGIYAGVKRKRLDLVLYSPFFIIFNYLNAYIFLEQFLKVIFFRQRELKWFHPARRAI